VVWEEGDCEVSPYPDQPAEVAFHQCKVQVKNEEAGSVQSE